MQLHYASGSLRQYLNISYEEKLKSEATPAEDIEGKLYQFIPADYTKSSTTFEETIEADSTSFRPMGEKLAAYVRPSGAYIASKLPKSKGKGKGKANGGVIELELDFPEDSPDAVVYEIYKVGSEPYLALGEN
jgi:histone acetyltransferase 1